MNWELWVEVGKPVRRLAIAEGAWTRAGKIGETLFFLHPVES